MRVLILNADYPRFLAWLYRRDPELQNADYGTQMAARNASLFGVADFYSRNFIAFGHTAAEVHVNNWPLQSAWAKTHGITVDPQGVPSTLGNDHLPGWLHRAVSPFKPVLRPLARRIGLSPKLDKQMENVLLSQIEDFRPDLILNQDIFYIDSQLMRTIKSIGKPIVIGQVGIAPPRGEDLTVYDLMISQLNSTVEMFRANGQRAEHIHLAFEPAILNALPKAPEADIDVSFVGTISTDHQDRIELLEAVAQHYDLKLWGNIPSSLPASSPLRRCFQGEVWGVDMYQVLHRSRITLNSHIDQAGAEAGNMRLFEATGVETFLLTDFKENLHTLFDLDREVAAWRSIDDCLRKIEQYLKNDVDRVAIARAGQAKTLSQHTYQDRAASILRFVDGM